MAMTKEQEKYVGYIMETLKADVAYVTGDRDDYFLFRLKMQVNFRPVEKFYVLEVVGPEVKVTCLEEADFKRRLPPGVTGN
jgi:hypothetical protein